MSVNKIREDNLDKTKISKIEQKLIDMKKNISKISYYIEKVWWKTAATDKLEKLLWKELSNEALEEAQPLIEKIKYQVLSKIYLLLDTVNDQWEYIEELLWQIDDSNNKKNKLEKDYSDLLSENKSLDNLASTDFLTWLWNRRKLEYVINILKNRLCKWKKWASFALLDIDDFKQVNTEYLQVWWDIVLKQFSNYFRTFFWDDWKYQYFRVWWEEFVVVSVEEHDIFNLKIQKFLKFVSSNKIKIDELKKNDISITFSAWTIYSRDGEWNIKDDNFIETSLSELLKQAKTNGKNRIESILEK